MRSLLLIALLCLSARDFAQSDGDSMEVVGVLRKAGKNRPELEKAINYFKRSGDPLKLKAIYFLIANMDIHYSADYYWEDGAGKKVEFNEFDYPDYEKAQRALISLQKTKNNIHAVPINIPDIESIKGDFLINNVNDAFLEWKSCWAKNIAFNDFCEFILPYRASVEPLQKWRAIYEKKFSWFRDSVKVKGIPLSLFALATYSKTWFPTTYGVEQRKEPLPRLGALQLLFRKKGPCEDMADLQVFALRSQGVPVSLNIIPFWATSTGSHFVNTVFDAKMKAIQYDASRPKPLLNKMLNSEPSKVIRTTYSKQPGTLASLVSEREIPPSFMQTVNYIDVTDQYWETTNVVCSLFPQNRIPRLSYICVFNGMNWRPAWWARVSGSSATFNSMSKGVVYLPTYYINEKIVPAGFPVAVGYHHQAVLNPDLASRRSISVAEKDKYLIFQKGKLYRLFYWDGRKWELTGSQIATANIRAMRFDKVPTNCLFILVPEYSKSKERPFIVTEEGNLNWF